MAEIIGIVTGLVGACDVTIKASRTIIKFISDFKNAPKDVVAIKDELENLEAMVAAVQGFLGSSKAQKQPPFQSSPMVRAIGNAKPTLPIWRRKSARVPRVYPKSFNGLGSSKIEVARFSRSSTAIQPSSTLH